MSNYLIFHKILLYKDFYSYFKIEILKIFLKYLHKEY